MPARNVKSWIYWVGLVIAAIGLVALINGLIHLLVAQTMGPQIIPGGPMMDQGRIPGGPRGTPVGMMPYFAHSWLSAVNRIVFGLVFLGVGAYMMSEGKRGK